MLGGQQCRRNLCRRACTVFLSCQQDVPEYSKKKKMLMLLLLVMMIMMTTTKKKTRYPSTHCHFSDGVILELHVFEIALHSFAPSEGTQDSLGFWNPSCGFQIPGTGFQSLSVELGFCILIISGIAIVDSLSCIPDSKPQDSGFHNQNFPRLQNSTSKNYSDSGICIPLNEANPSHRHGTRRRGDRCNHNRPDR